MRRFYLWLRWLSFSRNTVTLKGIEGNALTLPFGIPARNGIHYTTQDEAGVVRFIIEDCTFFYPRNIYVGKKPTGQADGTSFENATTLRDAMERAERNDTIYVAEGGPMVVEDLTDVPPDGMWPKK